MTDIELTDTLVEDDRWAAMQIDALVERAAGATLAHLGIAPAGYEIAVMACDDARIAVLNADFRGKPQATNVLSWPAFDLAPEAPGTRPGVPPAPDTDDLEPESLGDIAIAYEICLREAEAAEKRPEDHVTHLIVHGVLHLLGYDHIRDADATLMEAQECAILGKLGIADPYRDHAGPEALE